MKKIHVGKTHTAMVDDEDAERLRQFTWHYCKGYALRRVEIPASRTFAGGISTISMQREVMGLTFDDGKLVRTMDGDKLNCQKDNLVVQKIGRKDS